MSAALWVVRRYLERRLRRTSPPSPMGGMTDRALMFQTEVPFEPSKWEGIKPKTGSHVVTAGFEDELAVFQNLVALVHGVIDDHERMVLIALCSPLEHEKDKHGRYICDGSKRLEQTDERNRRVVTCPCGAGEYKKHKVREGDAYQHGRFGEQYTQETRDHAQVVGWDREQFGEPEEGFVIVERFYPYTPTHEQVAKRLGLTAKDVKQVVQTASRRVLKSRQYHVLMRGDHDG